MLEMVVQVSRRNDDGNSFESKEYMEKLEYILDCEIDRTFVETLGDLGTIAYENDFDYKMFMIEYEQILSNLEQSEYEEKTLFVDALGDFYEKISMYGEKVKQKDIEEAYEKYSGLYASWEEASKEKEVPFFVGKEGKKNSMCPFHMTSFGNREKKVLPSRAETNKRFNEYFKTLAEFGLKTDNDSWRIRFYNIFAYMFSGERLNDMANACLSRNQSMKNHKVIQIEKRINTIRWKSIKKLGIFSDVLSYNEADKVISCYDYEREALELFLKRYEFENKVYEPLKVIEKAKEVKGGFKEKPIEFVKTWSGEQGNPIKDLYMPNVFKSMYWNVVNGEIKDLEHHDYLTVEVFNNITADDLCSAIYNGLLANNMIINEPRETDSLGKEKVAIFKESQESLGELVKCFIFMEKIFPWVSILQVCTLLFDCLEWIVGDVQCLEPCIRREHNWGKIDTCTKVNRKWCKLQMKWRVVNEFVRSFYQTGSVIQEELIKRVKVADTIKEVSTEIIDDIRTEYIESVKEEVGNNNIQSIDEGKGKNATSVRLLLKLILLNKYGK